MLKMHPREKQFADLLDKQNRKWQYPAPRFKIKNTFYRPDFYLPEENLYIEVVGTRQAYHSNKKKIQEFKIIHSYINFTILDYKGSHYPQHIKNFLYMHKCQRCQYEWKSYTKSPKVCKDCHSYCWNGNWRNN